MYSNDKGFGLKDLIVKILFVVIFALLLVWLFRKNIPNMKPFYSNVFRENISYMQEAGKSYFTTDKLPTEIGKTTKLTLKEMQDMKLIVPFLDKDGNSCNMYESYVEVAKEENGYTLKTNLNCNTESDYIIEILGCYDYGCEKGCDVKETALEYQFKKTFSQRVTSYSCPNGYKRTGKYCYKTTTSTIGATRHYTDERTEVTDAEVATSTKLTTVDKVCTPSTTTKKEYKDATYATSTTQVCTDIRVPDPDCTVQCIDVWDSNLKRYVRKCNTCGYVTHTDCDDVTTTSTTPTCPSGYNDGMETIDGKVKCYKLVEEASSVCTCPAGTTLNNTINKCVKTVKVTSLTCRNKDAVLDEKTKKCRLTIGSIFSHFSCPSDKYSLDKDKGECKISSTDRVKATAKTSTKTWTKTKWSRSKTLNGWTATGKTRIVNL